MSAYDPQKAARVWQRVQSQQAEAAEISGNDNLQELIMNELAAAAAYSQLARQMGQKEAAILQRMGREEQSHAACLKGIYMLVNGDRPSVRAPAPAKEPVELTLRRSYGMELKSLKAYTDRSEDPEYGHVYRMLAQQEREHCRAILELLGKLQKK